MVVWTVDHCDVQHPSKMFNLSSTLLYTHTLLTKKLRPEINRLLANSLTLKNFLNYSPIASKAGGGGSGRHGNTNLTPRLGCIDSSKMGTVWAHAGAFRCTSHDAKTSFFLLYLRFIEAGDFANAVGDGLIPRADATTPSGWQATPGWKAGGQGNPARPMCLIGSLGSEMSTTCRPRIPRSPCALCPCIMSRRHPRHAPMRRVPAANLRGLPV